MRRRASSRVVVAVVLASQLACFPQSTVRKTFTVNVTTEPAEAEVQVEDVTGYHVVGKGSQPVKVEYDERIRTFHWANWFMPAVGAALLGGAAFNFMPAVQALGKPGTEGVGPFVFWTVALSTGFSLLLNGLILCIPGQIEPVKPDPTPEAQAMVLKHGGREEDILEANKTAFTDVRISASAPGFRPWSTLLDKPPEKASLVMRLMPEPRWAPGGYGPPPGYGPPQGYGPPPGYAPPPVPPPSGGAVTPPPPPPPLPGAPAAQRCAKDTDCPGEAICQGGTCQLPGK